VPHADHHRANARRVIITHKLIRALEDDASAAIERSQDDFPDYVLRRVAELREASR
jgi:hypothetical protein